MRMRLRIAGRVLAATLGAYAVTAGSAAAIAATLLLLGHLPRADALILGSFAGYILFAFLMLWCFAERRLGRVWLMLLAAAFGTHVAALLIERMVPVPGVAA
ncbi:hypothetical protein [Sphingomonas sp. T9W2]|uniref:hypothetical protein n=1 Tax=Sphingomonas sp. T9W2 TaxID=3143183 RepID=UPI0031F56826